VSSSAKTTWLARKLREKLGANTLAWSVLDRHLPASRTAAKAGSGRIVKPSWRPKPAPGKFSGSLGRQAGSGGRNRPILAAKAGSGEFFSPSWPRKRRVDFVRRNFGGEEWIVDLAMDSFGRQSSAKNSPGPGFSANLAPKFPPELFSRPILLAGTPFSPEVAMNTENEPKFGRSLGLVQSTIPSSCGVVC
jgi:hypothetical protein